MIIQKKKLVDEYMNKEQMRSKNEQQMVDLNPTISVITLNIHG